jgi:hypothetical protein
MLVLVRVCAGPNGKYSMDDGEGQQRRRWGDLEADIMQGLGSPECGNDEAIAQRIPRRTSTNAQNGSPAALPTRSAFRASMGVSATLAMQRMPTTTLARPLRPLSSRQACLRPSTGATFTLFGNPVHPFSVRTSPVPDSPIAAPTRHVRFGHGLRRGSSPAELREGPGRGVLGEGVSRGTSSSNAALREAIEAVEDGVPIRTAGRVYGIPATSLWDHLFGCTLIRKRGRQGVLTFEEEAELEDYLLKMQDLGYPLTIGQLRLKVAEIVQTRPNPFTHGIPGIGWLHWFRRRHANLVLRCTQGLDTN